MPSRHGAPHFWTENITVAWHFAMCSLLVHSQNTLLWHSYEARVDWNQAFQIPKHSNLEQGYSKNTILAKSRGGSVARRLRTLLWLTNVKPTQLSTALSHPCRQIMKSRFLLSLFLNSSRHQKPRKFPCHFVEQKVLLKRFHSRRGRDSAYEGGTDARRKFWIKPLKETDLGVAQAFFDP